MDQKNEHFLAVSSKSALLKKQIWGRSKKPFHCLSCNKAHKSEKARDNHQFLCEGGKIIEFLPRDKKTVEVPKMKFRNIAGLLKCPFVGCADSEDFLKPMYRLKGNAKLIQEHNASCWGCALKITAKVEYFDCYSENLTREFRKELVKRAFQIFEEYWESVIETNLEYYDGNDIPIDKIIKDEDIDFSCRYYLKEKEIPLKTKRIGEEEKWKATHCFLCKGPFLSGDIRVIDHSHFTGEYFGTAHKNCNVQRKSRAEIIIFFHNASNDFVELLPGLLDEQKYFPETKIKVRGLPKTGEKFISLTMEIKMAKDRGASEKMWS